MQNDRVEVNTALSDRLRPVLEGGASYDLRHKGYVLLPHFLSAAECKDLLLLEPPAQVAALSGLHQAFYDATLPYARATYRALNPDNPRRAMDLRHFTPLTRVADMAAGASLSVATENDYPFQMQIKLSDSIGRRGGMLQLIERKWPFEREIAMGMRQGSAIIHANPHYVYAPTVEITPMRAQVSALKEGGQQFYATLSLQRG